MTVRELIKVLEKFNQDKKVYTFSFLKENYVEITKENIFELEKEIYLIDSLKEEK